MDQRALSFGSFEICPAQRVLTEDGRPVPLGSRALDLLVLLVERAGQVVGKDELIARVWPSAVVEEATLRVHIAALRRHLHDGRAGQRYIVNVTGRGYSFVAPVATVQRAGLPPAPASPPASGLPSPIGRLVGRDETVAALAAKLRLRRFVTLVGPGGVGKTVVVVACRRGRGDRGRWRRFRRSDLGTAGGAGAQRAGLGTGAAGAPGRPQRRARRAPGRAPAAAGAGQLRACDRCRRAADRSPLRRCAAAAHPGHQPRASARQRRMGHAARAAGAAAGRRPARRRRGGALAGGAAFRRARRRGAGQLPPRRWQCRAHRCHLPPARRHPAGHRVGRCAGRCLRVAGPAGHASTTASACC